MFPLAFFFVLYFDPLPFRIFSPALKDIVLSVARRFLRLLTRAIPTKIQEFFVLNKSQRVLIS